MRGKIHIIRNQSESEWTASQPTITIGENEYVSFRIESPPGINVPKIFVEDMELTLVEIEGSNVNGSIYISRSGRIFGEVFGSSIVRVYVGDEEILIPFDVQVKKINTKQAEAMIAYLFAVSDSLIRVCLSRSTLPTGSIELDHCDPESMISTAEAIVAMVNDSKTVLQHHLRKRLVPVKSQAWMALHSSSGIDPNDVIDNLDMLRPSTGDGDVIVNGRHYSVNDMQITALVNSADVEENTILLGGMYSIRRGITLLYNDIRSGTLNQHVASHDIEYTTLSAEYESLRIVLARVTSGSMLLRCEELQIRVEEIIYFFEKVLHIKFYGERLPKITPFVRSSRIYRSLFEQLQLWYSLGKPSLLGLHFLIKLRSISKIYEYFALFKMADYFEKQQWILENVQVNRALGNATPSALTYTRADERVTLQYEPKVSPLNPGSAHLDLVDIEHPISRQDYWWKPDFVLKIEIGTQVGYMILDAKYSPRWVIINKSMPDLLNKYFLQMAVFDATSRTLDSSRIFSVFAIFPGEVNDEGHIQQWKKFGFNAPVPRLPFIGGTPLSPTEDTYMHSALTKMLEISIRKLRNM